MDSIAANTGSVVISNNMAIKKQWLTFKRKKMSFPSEICI